MLHYISECSPDEIAAALDRVVGDYSTVHPRTPIEVVEKGEGTVTLCLKRGMTRDLYAHLTWQGDEETGTSLTLTYEEKENGRKGWAVVAAHLTRVLLGSLVLWGATYGLSYLLGNRNALTPLIVPVLCFGIPYGLRALRDFSVCQDLERDLGDFLSPAPAPLADAESDEA